VVVFLRRAKSGMAQSAACMYQCCKVRGLACLQVREYQRCKPELALALCWRKVVRSLLVVPSDAITEEEIDPCLSDACRRSRC
jgi:hypothetical protein